MPRFTDVTWVNTIGTRLPSLSAEDIKKIAAKIKSWTRSASSSNADSGGALQAQPAPRILNPWMYPGFRNTWQRKSNAWLIANSIHRSLGPRTSGEQRVALTTIPLTADLIRQTGSVKRTGTSSSILDVDRWLYYCVDDFSVWPGLDSDVMQELELLQLNKVDAVVAASTSLSERLTRLAPASAPSVLTHGIDPDHWAVTPQSEAQPALPLDDLPRPLFLFWGLIDRRLDLAFCQQLANSLEEKQGSLVFIGPQQDPQPELLQLRNTHFLGPQPYHALPGFAQAANVLIMPYADLPVTQQMQPLKFKEYLATGKPVVARQLPSNALFSDACRLTNTPQDFVQQCWSSASEGLLATEREQRSALLHDETWNDKADQLMRVISNLFPESVSA